jgi:hypothetical protein
VLWPKINKDELIKVTIGLAELMRGRDTVRLLLMSQKELKDLQWDPKEFKATPRLYPRNSGFKGMNF